ncbi:uncharacterized protein [Macaca nemestrina]|uniref:uncharacterized protein n=1 Tax=Macaca nemestrina TaxID=9545 RepID=UPI0039B96D5B
MSGEGSELAALNADRIRGKEGGGKKDGGGFAFGHTAGLELRHRQAARSPPLAARGAAPGARSGRREPPSRVRPNPAGVPAISLFLLLPLPFCFSGIGSAPAEAGPSSASGSPARPPSPGRLLFLRPLGLSASPAFSKVAPHPPHVPRTPHVPQPFCLPRTSWPPRAPPESPTSSSPRLPMSLSRPVFSKPPDHPAPQAPASQRAPPDLLKPLSLSEPLGLRGRPNLLTVTGLPSSQNRDRGRGRGRSPLHPPRDWLGGPALPLRPQGRGPAHDRCTEEARPAPRARHPAPRTPRPALTRIAAGRREAKADDDGAAPGDGNRATSHASRRGRTAVPARRRRLRRRGLAPSGPCCVGAGPCCVGAGPRACAAAG